MTPFDKFLKGLRADARLARFIPPATANPTPETVVLTLAMALADAAEGNHPRHHPALHLLERMEATR